MNILHTEASLNWGGQELRTLCEHEFLLAHGHSSWLICPAGSALYQHAQARGTQQVVALDLTRRWRVDIALRIWWFCLRQRIAIINSHSSKDSALCALAYWLGIPLIRSRHISNPVKKIFAYRHACTHVLASAQVIAAGLIVKGLTPQKVTVIGESVDLSTFHPHINSAYLRTEFRLASDTQVVLNVGMLRADKGQDDFIAAALQVLQTQPNTVFLLAGEATAQGQGYAAQLRTQVPPAFKQSIVFLGYRDDVPALMGLADVVVVASTGTEGQSRIVPQAFAMARTVVVTNVGGLSELVQHEYNGLVVPPRAPQQMAAAITRLLVNNELRSQFASAGYQFATRALSFTTSMDKVLALYARFARRVG